MKAAFTDRRCPKCGGNMYVDEAFYLEGRIMGWYEEEGCLQCGYIIYESNSPQTEIAANISGVKNNAKDQKYNYN